MTENELLKYAVENGMIDMETVQKQIIMTKRQKYLKQHPYSIWEDKNGIWHTYLPDEKKGRIHKKRRSEEAIQDLIYNYWENKSENPTLREFFTDFIDRRLELKQISQATHLRETQIFNRHYSKIEERRIKNITENFISDFLQEEVALNDLTSKAYGNLRSLTKKMFKRARLINLVDFRIEDVLNDTDDSGIHFKKVIKEDYEEVFTEKDLPIMIDYLKTHVDLQNLGILLMFVTGVRVGELAALKHSDFEEHKGFYSFRIRRTETRYKGEDGKYIYDIKDFPKSNAGVRNVIIPKQYTWVYEELKNRTKKYEYVFFKNDKRMSTFSFRGRMRRVCKKLEICNKSPHKARKTYGSILLDNNLDKMLIIGQMGHADIGCTETYYHRNRRNIESKADIISNLPSFTNN